MIEPPSLRDGERCDMLSRSLRIIQRARGHRATSDDILLAWFSANAMPAPSRILELGCGKGTVSLLLLQRLPGAYSVGIEAFEESFELSVRNAQLNQMSGRFTPRHGDLRDATHLDGEAPFDLIVGAPPFMPPGSGVLPTDPQRAAGRFELRGGVEDYYLTAVRHLAPTGRVVILMDGHGAARNQRAAEAAGLCVHRRIDISPRPDRPMTYSVCVSGWHPEAFSSASLSMRNQTGDQWSEPYRQIRQDLDLPQRPKS